MSLGSQPKATGLFALPQGMAHGVRRFEEPDKNKKTNTDRAYQAVTKVCSGAAALIADKQTSLLVSRAIAFPVVRACLKSKIFD
jgi:hypothetical protein